MRALKINFGGPNRVTIDWNASVSGLGGLAQRAGVAVMTQRGSDKFRPGRGTDVASTIFTYGIFDLLGVQHTLNFGALKARADMVSAETSDRPAADRIASVHMSLIAIKNHDVSVAVTVSSAAGETSREITNIQ